MQLEPGNRDVRALHARFRKESAAASAKEAQFFSKAFRRIAQEPDANPTPTPASNGTSGASTGAADTPATDAGGTEAANGGMHTSGVGAPSGADVDMQAGADGAVGGAPTQVHAPVGSTGAAVGGVGSAATVEEVAQTSSARAADVSMVRP